MSSVLVTGATGFIGRAVLPLLVEAGHSVEAVRHERPVPDVSGVRWHACDLFDPAASEQLVRELAPDLLLHLAWEATPGRFWGSETNVLWAEASLRLVRSFSAAGGRRAVFAGSCAEYDPEAGVCHEEATPLRPDTLYGVCKAAVHDVVAAHSAAAGYSFAWGRIFHPFGAWEPPERLIPTLVNGLLEGRHVELTDGNQRRDFVAVSDVGRAFARLLSSELQGAVNIGSGRATSVREVAAAISTLTDGHELIRFGARAEDGGPVLMVADATRARRELGWSPRLAFEDGIAETVEWWRAQATR